MHMKEWYVSLDPEVASVIRWMIVSWAFVAYAHVTHRVKK